MNSSFSNGLSGVIPQHRMPTKAELRKMAWKAAHGSQVGGTHLLRSFAGGWFNPGVKGAGRAGQFQPYWKKYLDKAGGDGKLAVHMIDADWRQMFPDVWPHAPKKFPAKYKKALKQSKKPKQSSSGHSTGHDSANEPSSSGGSGDIVSPKAKESGMGWLGWTLLLGSLGGGAWWFVNSDEGEKPKLNKKSK